MSPSSPAQKSALVLLVNDEEWTARSVDTILRPNGYAVLLAYTAKQGLDLASKVKPDCVLVDYGLPDMTGADLSERLREMPTVGESTPILVISGRALSRPERIACLESGAWDVLKLPFDTEEFLLRMDRYLRAKQETDRALEMSHLDPLTGLYNVQGLTKRLREILADSVRHEHPLACVALGVSGRSGAETEAQPTEDEPDPRTRALAEVLAAVTRVSDIIARVGDDDFVIVAPSTDEEGAQRLADRLHETFDSHRSDLGLETPLVDLDLRAGYHALERPEPGDLLPEDLLTRAILALRQAQSDAQGDWLRAFDFDEPN